MFEGHLHHEYIDGPREFNVIPSPQAGAQAWSAGVAGAQTKWQTAIANSTKDQAGLAVAQQAKALANYNSVISSGEWARRLQAVGTQGWKAGVAAKPGNYGASAGPGATKYQNAATQLYPFEQQLQAQIDAARASGATPIQLVQMWMDGMAQFKQQYTP